MSDVVDRATRSRMMSGIRAKDTKPEVLIRKALHKNGFRYRLHDKQLPGKPDMVFPRYKAVIQVNGCFWHSHGCHLFKWPSTRKEFWEAKLLDNRRRDECTTRELANLGWRVLVIWECALKGKRKRGFEEVIQTTINWLLYDSQNASIEGTGEPW